MFRRRPLRRRLLMRPVRGAPLAERARRALMHGHQMMETGNYAEAAQVFEHLAKEAEARGMQQRAPQLYLRAARARLLNGQLEPSMQWLNKGLEMLAEAERWPAVYKAGSMAVDELKRQGHSKEAEQVQAWLDETLKDHPEAKTVPVGPGAAGHRPKLPAKCPFCGGSVRPDEVEWLDNSTAECAYCGSIVTAGE